MKLPLYDTTNKKTGEVDLPEVFSEPVNADLIKTAVIIAQLSQRQPHGSDPRAGKKSVAKLSRRRKKYKGSYGIGISRVPRKIMSHSGTRFNWVGAFAPGTVGGRRAHPPKSFTVIKRKINKKESTKALRSAIAATLQREVVSKNGYRIPDAYPFALDMSFETLEKTKDAVKALSAIGFSDELDRASVKTVRAGRGTTRGRTYRRKRSILLVVPSSAKISRAIRNIPGIEAVGVSQLNIMHLAPGAVPGRVTLFTKHAVEEMAKHKLFTSAREAQA